jgi:hypothetical protein
MRFAFEQPKATIVLEVIQPFTITRGVSEDMPIGRTGRNLMNASLRVAVWLAAAIYLGRFTYNNTLYDLKQRHPLQYVLRTLSIGIFLGFVYWNVVVMPNRLTAMIWAAVTFGVAMVVVWKTIVDACAEYISANDPLNRKLHHTQIDDDSFQSIADIATRDDANPADD